MKTLSTALLTELGLTVTRPGYLVQLGFSTTLYLSTLGGINWKSNLWVAANVKVSSIGQDGSGGAQGTLTLGNSDSAYGALVLNEGASDIPVTIYKVYAGATALADVENVFSGVTDGADITRTSVTLNLVSQKNTTLYSPRVFIDKASGFNFLQPTGTIINVGTETFVLERAK